MDTNANSGTSWGGDWGSGWSAEQDSENTSYAGGPVYGGNVKQEFEDTPVAGGGIKQEFDDSPFIPERGFYQASTEDTWEAYQALISLIEALSRRTLPCAVMCGTADEVLSVLKSNNIISPWEKKAEIEKILKPIPDFIFNQMVSTAKLITDYYVGSRASKTEDWVGLFVPEKDFYQPKSEETSTAYKLLLDLVNNQFGCEQPQIVQCVLAHEVLVTLKDASIENSKKREMIEYTLNKISDEIFDLLLFIGDLITDFDDCSTEPNASGAYVPRSEYIDQNPIQWSPPGFDFKRGGQTEVDSAGGLYNNTYDDEPFNATDYFNKSSSLDILRQYSSSEDEPSLTTDDFKVLADTELAYSSKDEPRDDINLLTGAKRAYNSDDDDTFNLKADAISPTGSKRFCSSEDGPANPGADVNACSSGTKLEYSSEEELMYFDYDKARVSDKEDEDDWVKIDYDEDGI